MLRRVRAVIGMGPLGRALPVPLGMLLLAATASAALAQAPTSRIRGSIDHLSGSEMVVDAGGGPVTIAVPDGVRLTSVAKASLADIKPGTFIGTAAMPAGEELRALEVVVFPEAMRGVGEGHRAWDLLPESTMTNATVTSTVGKVEGERLELSYKGGEKAVLVPPGTPIVTLAPATRPDLKPGARVVVSVSKDAEGRMTAASIIVGKDGVDPPM